MKIRRVVRVPYKNTGEFKKDATFRVTKDTKYQPFNNEKYNWIVKQARASKNAQNKFTDKRNITNLSLFRQGLLPQPQRSKKISEVKK